MEKYLKKTLGEECGKRIWSRIEAAMPRMVSQLPKSKSWLKRIAIKQILPVIALYKVLKEDGREDTFTFTYRYMIEEVGESNNKKFRSMEKVPGFFSFYKAVYWYVLHHNDLCGYEFGTKDKNHFSFFVTRCLWLDVCTQFGVPELTVCWCHADTAGFKDLKTMEFRRSLTLAEDGKPCDYCFVRKRKNDEILKPKL